MANKKRLIDANALMDTLRELYCAMAGHLDYNDGIERAIDAVDDATIVDAVEVVRCKDCKHRRNDEDYASGHYCVKRPSNGGYFCEDDDFCSYGERREGE